MEEGHFPICGAGSGVLAFDEEDSFCLIEWPENVSPIGPTRETK